ncbi:OHCU decarboxylase [Iodidimonas gelatinilytica]|uniref:2-oxo-4-hydroxy-4-carboxy-5-ureidoimidazoline decarboxylase n=1 Tax=Iodidimonas gelatinilytica TaxID=1236966 RepID=A0A5A7MS20_9PROT|nr:2-oxo-4-hydroxy-4-carboxy-5-ureidoimidazoline decarboxylase [Iodidimonas gelatinilytica]GEQ98414.1 OHCU decarboxylase [Iodidimonas gelatinilytica]GER00395.1 OHCU decarboxylase [Iodidimonas gelatinilytica]
MSVLSPRPSALTTDAFIEAFGGIYEHSPWVAQGVAPKAASGALDAPADLHKAMHAIVEAASDAQKLALIKAHPDLAGRAALAGNLSKESTTEQTGAGLDRLTPTQFARFQKLNDAYQSRFGFPFVIAVRGLVADDILAAFETRLQQDSAAEFKTALAEIHKIARLRLDAMAA